MVSALCIVEHEWLGLPPEQAHPTRRPTNARQLIEVKDFVMNGMQSVAGVVPPSSLHVAIIMDGNGRWAKSKGLPRAAGHKRGVEAVRAVVDAAPDLGVTHMTLFGFSSENWRRPEQEVSALMGLLGWYLRNEVKKLHRDRVCIRFIGERERLPRDIIGLMADAEALTADNKRLILTIALSYGGRADMVSATQALAKQVANGTLRAEDITEDLVSQHMMTSSIPDPDLVIRSSGEQRISNFLLWQSAYSEFIFVDTLWPDFGGKDLEECLSLFRQRDRRFGAVAPA